MKGAAATTLQTAGDTAGPTGGAFGRPRLLTSFIGREDEVATIVDLLQSGHRLITITGPGGVGKTRLALAVAAALDDSPAFPEGDVFVTLASVADEALVIPTIARTLGVVAEDERPPVERLATALQGRRLLLTVDNLEHVVGAASELGLLLKTCPLLTILATSRRALRLTGEQEFSLAPLPVPTPQIRRSPAELATTPAVALFLARVTSANPAFVLTEVNAAAVADVCARLDGLPLAIELAAARVKVLSPQALAARLTGRLQLLTSGPRDLPRRQQTLRDAIAWSYDLLLPEEQSLFRRLAVFAGGFTLEAAEAVAGAGGWGLGAVHETQSHALAPYPQHPAPSAFDVVSSLVDHSLLVQEEMPDGEPRFRMLETVREYALDHLEAAGEAEKARDSHAAFFLDLAERAAEPEYLRIEAVLFRRLEPEIDNVRTALGWLLVSQEFGSERAQLGLRLAGAMVRFWDTRGFLREEADWLGRALSLVPEEPTRSCATALTALGVNAWFTGDIDQAVTRQEQALAIWRALGDPKPIVRSLWFLGLVASKRGDITRLEALAAECAPLVSNIGITLWQTVPDSLLALAALTRGNGRRVRELFKPVLAYQTQHGFLWSHAWVVGLVAEAAMLEGDRLLALAHHQQSLREFGEAGDVYATLDGLVAVASHATAFGQVDSAARLLGVVSAARAAVGQRLTWKIGTEDEVVAATRTALGDAAFDEAIATGRTLPLPDAIALALAVRPDRPARAPVPSTPAAPASTVTDDPFGLSPREREVLRLLTEGHTNREIGETLFISPRTAGTHVTNILAKLGVNSRSAAVAVALNRRLV
jgi:non-specific serine/threonine protein kinase